MIRPVLEVPSSISHLGKRAEEFLRDNPGSEIGGPLSHRTGCVVVSGKPREAEADTLEELLDEMDRLAAIEAERVKLQEEYPARRIWLSSGFRWYAPLKQAVLLVHEDGATRSAPMTLDADDAAGLRERLAKERRSPSPDG